MVHQGERGLAKSVAHAPFYTLNAELTAKSIFGGNEKLIVFDISPNFVIQEMEGCALHDSLLTAAIRVDNCYGKMPLVVAVELLQYRLKLLYLNSIIYDEICGARKTLRL